MSWSRGFFCRTKRFQDKMSMHKCSKQPLMSVTCFASAVARFFVLFEKYEGYKTGKLKLKKPEQLQVSLGLPLVLEEPCR